jgi:hypothetical protein
MLSTNYVDRELLLPLVMQLLAFLRYYSYAHNISAHQMILLHYDTSVALSPSSALPL